MAYIRLQSKEYEINENSMSFEWGFESLEYAMYEDISNQWISLENTPEHLKEVRDELSEMELDWDNINPDEAKRLRELWKEYVGWGMVLPGVSAFDFDDEQEAAENLLEYFQERDEESLSDSHYVLIFEGSEHFSEGHNGEEVVNWERDIERVPVKEFFNRYGLEI